MEDVSYRAKYVACTASAISSQVVLGASAQSGLSGRLETELKWQNKRRCSSLMGLYFGEYTGHPPARHPDKLSEHINERVLAGEGFKWHHLRNRRCCYH
jgi:hypothetical protein